MSTSTLFGLAGLVTLSLSSAMWFGYRSKKQQVSVNNAATTQIDHRLEENKKLKSQLAQQSQALQKQKQQLELLYSEFKKQQTENKQPTQPQVNAPSSLALACSMFGFEVQYIPDVAKVKHRYKQLCKIYHPDLKGSDDEMKRLNHALKVILAHKKQS
ncbi:hypothetical protein JCM19238_1326 [Vibrio ponticus]|nr:hypothetical protein JCM19238_1326 [Vibrio ponticus]